MSGPVAGIAYTFNMALLEVATGGLMTSPPFAAGDFTIAKDEGVEANLTTLPTATGRVVKISLSASELTGVSRVMVLAHDPDGIWGDWSWSARVESVSIETALGAIQAKTDTLPASPAAIGSAMTLTSGERDSIGAALLDLANSIETALTLRGALRLIAAACAGKASGLATATATYRNAVADSKNRLVATVDADGNRTAITTDTT